MHVDIENNRAAIYIGSIEVGFANIKVDEEFLISDVYVYPGYQEQGYGYKLICYLIDMAKAMKKDVISSCWYVKLVMQGNEIKGL